MNSILGIPIHYDTVRLHDNTIFLKKYEFLLFLLYRLLHLIVLHLGMCRSAAPALNLLLQCGH